MTHKPQDIKLSASGVTRYLEVLSLKKGASMDEVNTAYYTIIKNFPQNPTDEQEAHLQELKHAYDLLRRSYVPPAEKPDTYSYPNRVEIKLDRKFLMPVAGLAAIALVGVLLMMNAGTIKASMTHYQAGETLRFKAHVEPFGRVTGYETSHNFGLGNPTPAYSFRTPDGNTVWVSEHVVAYTMMPVESQ